MLQSSHTTNVLSASKKIRKSSINPIAISKPVSNNRTHLLSNMDPIKSPFFARFFHYPPSIKNNIMKINRKPQVKDLEILVKDLSSVKEFIDIEEMRGLVKDQERVISVTLEANGIKEKRVEVIPKLFQEDVNIPNHFYDLKFQEKKEEASEVESNFSSKDLQVKRESSFSYETSISTTPTKKDSPLFKERKNLLMSSQIQNILCDKYEIFVKKFDEESLNLESLEEDEREDEDDEKEKHFCEGMWEEKGHRGENEAYFLKGFDMERSLFENDKDYLNFI